MPFHYTSQRLRMPTPSTSIATQIPHAVGAALASKVRREDAVTFCWFGDGATSKGDFHEGLSFASIHRLPIVFICENNQYAISVPLALQSPVPSVAERAAGYGIPAQRCDGMSVQETYAAVSRAAARAGSGEGPSLVEALVYRLGPHTSHDDDSRYRSREEVASWESREPVGRLRAELFERGLLDEAAEASMQADVGRGIGEALAQAEAAPEPDPSEAFRDLLADYVAPNPFERRSRTGESAPRQSGEGIHATGTRE
jgi:2-oxoisovalerate dehydrogenase E1 component alpha subunit